MTLKNNKDRDSAGSDGKKFDGKKIGVVKNTTTAVALKKRNSLALWKINRSKCDQISNQEKLADKES